MADMWAPAGLVAAGLGGRHDVPGRHGSASRHSDVRGSEPQVGNSQEGALTSVVSGLPGGHRRNGDRSCHGGAPARRDDVHLLGRSAVKVVAAGVDQAAAISAHRNPASARAMAVATMLVEVLRTRKRRKRPHSRSWAAQARATTWGPGPAGGGRSGRRWRGGTGRPRPTRPAGCAGGGCRLW
jgi:hypothetical protein